MEFTIHVEKRISYGEREVIFMPNALFNRGTNGHMSMHDMDFEWLRRQAYLQCIENADIKKVDKIVDGIKAGRINKANLFTQNGKESNK